MSTVKTTPFIEELKILHKALPEIIRELEAFEGDEITATLRIFAHNSDTPIDLLDQLSSQSKGQTDRFNAIHVSESFGNNATKIMRCLAEDVLTNTFGNDGVPFSNSYISSLSKLDLYGSNTLENLFALARLPVEHLLEFKQTFNKASGYFYIADGFTAQKYSILDNRNEIKGMQKASAKLRHTICEIQKTLFGFVVGSVQAGARTDKYLHHFLNTQRLITGLEVTQTLYADIQENEFTAWLFSDQLSGHRDKLPMKAFIHTMSEFLRKHTKLTPKGKVSIGKKNVRFIADCIKEFGVEYSDATIRTAMENLQKKQPKLKTAKK